MIDSLRILGPVEAHWTVLLSHGAGASTSSPFFAALSDELLHRGAEIGGLRVALFDFPYMMQRLATGKRRPPDPMPRLQEAYVQAIRAVGVEPDRLVIGGKSMGGRVASLVADDAGVAGLVCLGYPFHPRAQPEKLRTAHLEDLVTATLICQGTRDALGSEAEVTCFPLSSAIGFHWLPDGDHDLVPRKRSGHTQQANWEAAAAAVIRFIGTLR